MRQTQKDAAGGDSRVSDKFMVKYAALLELKAALSKTWAGVTKLQRDQEEARAEVEEATKNLTFQQTQLMKAQGLWDRDLDAMRERV